jgi:hypothetical protein
MKSIQSIKIGAWIIISINILMALGSIWVFMRMAPAIEVIIDRNEKSLQACEEMLSAMVINSVDGSESIDRFISALSIAENNITEYGEKNVIEGISAAYKSAFTGDEESILLTVQNINKLSEINRTAMIRADIKARQLGNAGAWGVVFMATLALVSSLVFMKQFRRSISGALMEIYTVIKANKSGETFRRCSDYDDIPKDISYIYSGINELLDSKK